MVEENLVFVCGALRSGTTVLGLMLDNHPNVKNPGEFDFMYDYMIENGGLPDVTKLVDNLRINRIFNAHKLSIESGLSSVQLLKSFVRQMERKNKILSLNIHRNFDCVPYLFPDARYIHLLRDARDVARSSIGMGWAGNVYYGVDHWINSEKSWDRLENKISEEKIVELNYEELIEKPIETLEKITNFLGVSFSDKMLSYDLNSTYSKPDTSLIWQWKRKQSEYEVQTVESKAGMLMISRGYNLSGYPSIKLNLIQKIKLFYQNKLYRINHNIQRYGLILYISDKLTRLPIFRKWRSVTTNKISDIDIMHLK